MAGGRVLELESVGQLGTAQYTIYTMTKNFPLRPSPLCVVWCRVSTLYTLYTHYTACPCLAAYLCADVPSHGPSGSRQSPPCDQAARGVSFVNSPSCNINLTTTATVVSQVATTTAAAAAHEILISQATNHIKQPQH